MKNISKKTVGRFSPYLWLMAFLLSMSLLNNRASAQTTVASLPFTNDSATSFSYITSGGGATTISTSTTDDDDIYSAVTIPFSFPYAGSSFTSVGVTANGYVHLGGACTGNYAYSPLALQSEAYTISIMCGDLIGIGNSTSSIMYQTLGTAPNRQFVIQWRDWGWWNYSTTNVFSCQLILSESGQIQIVYNNAVGTSTSLGGQVGLTGASTADYYVLANPTSWATAASTTTPTTTLTFSSSNLPNNGRRFNWTPPPMYFDSVSTIQVTAGSAYGSTSQPIIGIVFYTHGVTRTTPLTVSSILCNMTGTTNTSDVTNAYIKFTKNVSTYSTGAVYHTFGTVASPSGTMFFSGLDTLVPGANYFWLTYDLVNSSSTVGDALDGQCTLVTDSSTHAPNVTNPPGNVTITGPFTGTYTINPSGSGASNFVSFDAAILAMQASGIAGPVTFIVSPATYSYSSPLILPCITGMSSTNTVTFDGGGSAASRIISGSIATRALVYVNCSYYTLRNLTITNTYSGACGGIGIVTGKASITINNCIVSIPSAGTNTSSSIFTATSTTDYYGSGATTVDSLTLDSNSLSGGYYGMYLYGNSSSSNNRNFKIRKNTTSNVYYEGDVMQYIYNNIDFMYNTVNMSSAYGYFGVYFYYCTNTGTLPTNFIGNKIMNWTGYGIYCYYPGGSTAANTARFYNNMVIGALNASYPYDYYGFYLQNTNNYTQIFNNTISIPQSYSSNTYAGISANGSSYTSIKNNVIANTAASGSAINLYCGTAISNDSVNFNVYSNSSNSTLVYNNGSYATAATFNTPSSGGDSSYNVTPVFVNNVSDLHLASGCSVPTGQNLTGYVPTDFDLQTRSVPPRIGCDEPSFLSNDLSMDKVISPVAPVAAGSSTLSVQIKNAGSTTITSATVGYILNGGSPVTAAWTGSLGACATTTYTFGSSVTLLSSNILKTFVANPNGSTDPNHNNDTITSTINASLAGGTYTINGSLPASGTNFQTFAAAVTALSNGILGPVVFQVAAGTYTQASSLIIPPVAGANAVNTITFEGGNGNAATRIVTGNIATLAVVYIGCPYITMRNLTVSNTYTSNCGTIGILASATGCRISNCNVTMPIYAGTSSALFTAPSTTSYYASASSTVDSLTIDSNTISGGYYTVYIYGSQSSSNNRNFKIRNNTVINGYYYGMLIQYNYNNIDFMNNTVDMIGGGYGYMGVYFYFNTNTGSLPTNITGNKIMNWVGYGLYCYTPGGSTAANTTRIYNNMIIGANNGTYPYDYYGIYLQNSNNYTQLFHNTILIPQSYTSTSYAGISANGSAYTAIKNNVIVNTATSGSAINLYCGTSILNDSVNFNVYYNKSNTNLVYNGGAYGTPANFNTPTKGGDSSFNQMPLFVNNANNLRLAGPCSVPTGQNLTYYVPTDIDGATRVAPPRMGCSEPAFVTNDLAMDSMTAPVPPISPGSSSISVKIRNTGSTPIYSANVAYQYNGGTPSVYAWSGTLGTCQTAIVTFPVPVTLGSINSFKLWTAIPNGTTDNNRNNDTLIYNYFTPLSGVFTINGASPSAGTNFQTFGAAVSAILTSGVAGPVTFNVAAGTYNEQVDVSGTIIGLNAGTPIVFDGGAGNTATRVVVSNQSGAALRINQQRYITFNHLTFTNNFAGACVGATIVGNTTAGMNGTGCAIKNCVINLPNVGTNTAYGISMTATASGAGFSNTYSDSVSVDSNTINGGYYGIGFYGAASSSYNRNIAIRGNTLNNIYYYGMYIYNIYNPFDMLNNTVNMSGSAGYYGMYIISCTNSSSVAPTRVNGNKVTNFYYYGIYTSSIGGTATAQTQFFNNLILSGTTNAYYCLYLSATYALVHHNTLLFYFNTPTTSYTPFYNATTNVTVMNNIFGVEGTSSSASSVYLGSNPYSGADSVEYNIYYNKGTGALGYRNGTFWTGATPATTFAAAALGVNSSTLIPSYVSSTNFHLTSGCGGVRGANLNYWVPVDFDGITRSTSPVVGCYEYPSASNDLAVQYIVAPVFPVSAGSQNIRVKIQNTGGTTITSTTMAYRLNGGSVVSSAFSGSLAPCDTTTFTFSSVTLLTGNNSFKVYSSLPNSSADGNMLNDTLNVNLGTPMSGTYTINLAAVTGGTNYQTFDAAILDLGLRGVSGPVTFNVSSGTYNPAGGNLTLGNLNSLGASAANTITFKSVAGIPDSVVINGNSSGYILTMNNTSYVNFMGISFVQPTASASGCIQMTGSPSFDMIYNCKITFPVTTSSGTYSINANGTNMNGVTIRKCAITGAYYGSYLYSLSTLSNNVTVDSNTYNGQVYASYMIYHKNLKFNANTVNLGTGPYVYGYLLTEYIDSASEFAYNKIYTPNSGGYGYVYSFYYFCIGNASQHLKFHDNRFDASGTNSYMLMYYPGYYGSYIDYYNNYLNLGTSGYVYYMGYQSQNVRFYNNTVYSGYTYSVYYYNSGTLNMDIKNNTFYNNGSGSAFYHANAFPGTTETFDYNNYYAASSTTPIYSGGSNDIGTWKTMAGNLAVMRDRNSLSYPPGFTSYSSPANLAPNLSDSSVWSLNGRGMPVSWITTDGSGNPRSTSVATGPVDIGAFEFTPNVGVLPPLATNVPATPSAGTTQYFVFGGDTLASVVWPSLVTVPTSVGLRAYPGINPPNIGTAVGTTLYTKAYWNLTAFPASSYNCTPVIYYKDNWMGTVPNKTNMKLIAKYPTTSWASGLYSSSPSTFQDTVNDFMAPSASITAAGISNAYFAGTTASNPVPVQMDKFIAVRTGNSGLVSWTTASEINSDYFIVERSFDGISFTEEATIKAAGNSSKMNAYSYTDLNVVTNNPSASVIFYRLKMVDRDGSYAFSGIASINISTSLNTGVTVYPNPFTNELNITVNSVKATTARIEVVDIQGRVIAIKSVDVNKGDNKITLSELSNMNMGIYFLNMSLNGETVHAKVMKN